MNGSPAAEGTQVVALIDGVEVASTTVLSDGEIEPLFIVGNVGKTVTFRIGNLMADQSFTIERGELDSVTLTASN